MNNDTCICIDIYIYINTCLIQNDYISVYIEIRVIKIYGSETNHDNKNITKPQVSLKQNTLFALEKQTNIQGIATTLRII